MRSCPQLPGILALLGHANEPVTGHAAAVLRCCARQEELVHRLEPALPRLMSLLRKTRPRTSAARQVRAERRSGARQQSGLVAQERMLQVADALPLPTVPHREP